MLECTTCNTLNPNTEATCLACGAPLAATKSTGISGATGRCPNGHPVDPTWTTCPYCDRQSVSGSGSAARATRLEAGPGPAASTPQKTRLEVGSGAGSNAKPTRLAGEPLPSVSQPDSIPPQGSGVRATRLESPAGGRGRPTVLHAGSDRPQPIPDAAVPPPRP